MTSIPKSPGIYLIRCLANNRIYVGSTANLRRRRCRHFSELRRHIHKNAHLQRAWDKYGEQSFTFEILELVLPTDLLNREQYWLDTLQPFEERGFNIGRVANTPFLGRTHTPEARAKISAASKGNQYGKGHSPTPETRAIIGAAHKGNKYALGYHHTPEARAKISATHRGQKRNPEWGEKIRIAKLGKKCLPETIEKIRSTSLGRKQSPETIAKRTAKLRGRKRPAEAIEKTAEPQRKSYIVTNPDGIEIIIHGLTKFCREHGLSHAHMASIASGKRKHHKGWRCRYA